MKFRNILIFVLVSVPVIFTYGFTKAENNQPNYGFNVSIQPDSNKTGVFQGKLVISEIPSGKIVAQPTIRFKAGQSAEATSGKTKNGVNFKFSVLVDEKGSVAEYDAAVLDSTSEISRSQAKISLK